MHFLHSPTPLENGRVDFAWSPGEITDNLGFDRPSAQNCNAHKRTELQGFAPCNFQQFRRALLA